MWNQILLLRRNDEGLVIRFLYSIRSKLPSYFLRLLLFCLAISSGFCHAEDTLNTKIPVIQINTEGLSPLDIGLTLGQKTKLLFADIEKRYDAYLFARFSQLRFNDTLSNRLPKLRQHVDDAYRKELEGVASTWSLIHDNKLGDGFLSWDEYWLLNLLPDIGLPTNGTGFGVLQQSSKEKGAIIGRNLDLKSTSQLRSLQTITVYQYANNKAIVNIGFAGLISVITGFNQSGLFVAHFNAAPDSSYQNQYQIKKNEKHKVEAHVFALRKALETFSSAKQATHFLSKNHYSVSSNTLVADKKDIRVLEYSKRGKIKVRQWDSQLRANNRWGRKFQIAVVDCHVLSSMTNNCRRAKDNFRWKRLHSLASDENNKIDTQDISKIMMDTNNQYYEIMGADTIQSMIFLPASGHLYLYAAPPINTTKLPPLYQVYYQDLMPHGVRTIRNKTYYFWWLAGLLTLMAAILWWVKRSMKKNTTDLKSV